MYDRRTMSDLPAAMALGRDCQDDVVIVLPTTSCTICRRGKGDWVRLMGRGAVPNGRKRA